MTDFKKSLCEVDNGRFAKIIEAMNVTPECERCAYLFSRKTEYYKCNVAPICIAATLHPNIVLYLKGRM